LSQLRGITKKNPLREDSLRHAHEFGHTALVTANGGELFTHDRVNNALHGSKKQARWRAWWSVAGVDHGRQGNQIPDFLTVGVTPASSLCRLHRSIQPATQVGMG
jgi:hypothetical protein